MKKYNAFFVLGFMLLSCVKEYPLKPSGKMQPLPVFHMFLQPDSLIAAQYSHAADITDKILDEDAASIEIYKNNISLGTMTAMGKGIYNLVANKFSPRDSYWIKSKDMVNVFSVRGTIPSKIQIASVDTITNIVAGIGPAFNFELKFTDSAADNNTYRLWVKRHYFEYVYNKDGQKIDSLFKTESLSIFGSDLSFLQNNFNNYTSKEILFTDATFNGTLKKLKFYTTQYLYLNSLGRTTKLEIILENMDVNMFNYYNTRNAHLWQQQSISQLPGFILGNIPGGYGLVGGFTISKRIIGFE